MKEFIITEEQIKVVFSTLIKFQASEVLPSVDVLRSLKPLGHNTKPEIKDPKIKKKKGD